MSRRSLRRIDPIRSLLSCAPCVSRRFATLLFAVATVSIVGASGSRLVAQDLARLAHPDVAERVGLDDEQRAAIQRLIQQRATEVAATPDDREAIATRFQQAARALLSDEQWNRFAGAPSAEPLRFNFRDQPWTDVLEWFARQADSSLVMDEVPPGTFTYSDLRSYSPAEAIDLLNGVLLTRGFTLVRREKMLLVLRVSDSIPLELIPRVKLEELAERGRFEMVAVEFSIGDRAMDAVLAEVTPYLGAFGRAVPLPQSRKLIVVEAAGKMETINVLIASVPGPPPRRPDPPPPPKPVFATYSIGNLDPASTLETIGKLIGEEGLTVDAKTNVLNAFVIPDRQGAIASFLEQMIAKQSERGTSRLAVYEVDAAAGLAVRDQVASAVPGATATLDTAGTHLMISGDDATLDEVAKLLQPLGLKQLGGGVATDGDRALQVHRLPSAQVASVAALLEELLPSARLVPDVAGGRLIAEASPTDQQRIVELIGTLETMERENQPLVRRLPTPEGLVAADLARLAALVPAVTATLDPSGSAIVVTGPAADQDRLAKLIESWSATAIEPAERSYRTYRAADAVLARFRSVTTALPDEFRGMTIVPSETSGELTIVADAATHDAVAGWIERLSTEATERPDRELRSFPIDTRRRALATAWVTRNLPAAELLSSPDDERLLVSATSDELERLATFLDRLATELPEQDESVLIAYPVEHADPTTLAPLLQRLVGDSEFVVDVAGRQIVAVTTLAKHARLKGALQQIDRPEGAVGEPELRGYDLGGLGGTTVLPMLQPLWPTARLSIDTNAGRLLAFATPLQHEELAATLDMLAGDQATGNRSLKVHPVAAGDLTSLPTILRQIAPGALLSVDPTSRTVSAWGTDEEQKKIESALTQLGSVAQDRLELRIHDISSDRTIARERGPKLVIGLTALFPAVRVSLDDRGERIVAFGPAAEQERVREFLERVVSGEPGLEGRTMRAYRLGAMTAAAFETLLGRVAPGATATPVGPTGPVAVWGTDEEHAAIDQALQGIERETSGTDDMSLRTYEIPRSQAATFPTLLARLRPTATIVSGSGTTSVVVFDLQAGHAILGEWVVSMTELDARGSVPILRSHTVREDLKGTVVAGMTVDEPTIRWVTSSDPRSIVAWGTEAQQTSIAAAIRDLEAQVPAPAERRLARHPLGSVDRARLIEVLEQTLDELEIVPSPRADELVAFGTDEEHARVDEIVAQLAELGLEAGQATARVVSWRTVTLASTTVAAALEGTIPAGLQLRPIPGVPSVVISGADEAALATFAAQIERTVDELSGTDSLVSRPFPLEHADPTAAATVLRAMLPQRIVAADPASRQIAVTAEPDELERVAEFLKQFDVPPLSGERTTKIYRISQGSARGLGFSLSEMLPEATVFGDRELDLIVATAGEKDHAKIAAVIEQYELLGSQSGRETRVFLLQRADAGDIENGLQSLAPEATIAADVPTNSLIVTATAADLERIDSVVRQIEEGTDGNRITRPYSVGDRDPDSIRSALSPLLPGASIVSDSEAGLLLVTADESAHAQVTGVLDELKKLPGREPIFRAYALEHAAAEAAAEALGDAMPRSRSLGIGFDAQTSTLFVVARPEEHETIDQMIRQIDRPPVDTRRRRLQTFPLSGVDGDSVVEAVEALFVDARPAVDVDYDEENGRLVIVGDDEQLERVGETIRQFDPPSREIAIFTILRNDPSVVAGTIDDLFSDEPFSQQPTVTIDSTSGQLLVRGEARQLERVRELLARLGEATDAEEPVGRAPGSGRGRVRSLPASARLDEALRRVREIWPEVRSNPIEVLGPDDDGKRSTTPDKGSKSLETPQEPSARVGSSDDDALGSVPQQELPAAPIVVIPGIDRWTLASDDLEALDQFETLLQAALERGSAVATIGSFSVHLLKNVGADDVAETLNDLYRRVAQTGRGGTSLGRVSIVADDRINALIVHAGRLERETIEELIAVMDSDELMLNLKSPAPELIPLRHVGVERALRIVQTVYRSQLSSGGGRRAIPIPEGVSPEIATVLQQVNAAASAPLLTVEGDEDSSSLIVRGPDEVVADLKAFIAKLDDPEVAARGTRVDVIRLEGTNGERMDEAIRQLMRSRRR